MSFASASNQNLRRVPAGPEGPPGLGRGAIVADVDRWFADPARTVGAMGVLLVVDVDLDDALPTGDDEADDVWSSDDAVAEHALRGGDAEEHARRGRLGHSVEQALSAQVRPGDAVVRIDAGRFAVLRERVEPGRTARSEAADLARRLEGALIGCPDGYGARVTTGGTTLVAGVTSAGQELLGRVTGAMLAGKLFTDDRVVVVAA